MSTNYSREITNCQRNSNDIVQEIHVDWTATKTLGIGTTVSAKYLHKMPIAPAGQNPIKFTSITKSNLEDWYDNEIQGKYKVAAGIGSTGIVDDSVAIEERIKEQLDNRIFDEEYKIQVTSTEDFINDKFGLPF
tara:strand:+ start:1396 stop:1797 length:402 start_codon:yes stop_codon:yes gene_type:complete